MPVGAEPRWAADTSVAVPALLSSHPDHERCLDAIVRRRPALAGHAAVETWAVLTRLPIPDRLTGQQALLVLDRAFPVKLTLPTSDQRRVLRLLASFDATGGSSYDAIVALAALRAGARLLTRDQRALQIYAAVGTDILLLD